MHTELVKLLKVEGQVGDAARQVAKLLHAHFEKEEEFALPPLGLLPALASGKVTPEMNKALALTDKLKAELPAMLHEHEAVVGALKQLAAAAEETKHAEAARFAEQLNLHAQTEEQVLYPAAILVGEFVKLTRSR
ncbi:MAG: hemerythrin domain-containing protein [Verrucomicrobia bacterium]|nr:hemerythrin domain-containing protein [Verrucomicrobiota bacterium]